MAIDRRKIEEFVYREARLMDEHRYDEWEALWTDDAIYWVPCNEDDIDPTRHVSIIYDDRTRIGHRITRLKSGEAHAQDPPSRMRRVISNFEIEEADGGEVIVRSNFLLVELRHEQNLWAGTTTHRLRPDKDAGGLKLAFKKVLLVNNDAEMPALAFLI